MLKKLTLAIALILAASTATRAADLDKLPNPMAKAKAGQWVSYKLMGGAEQKQTITAIEGSGDDQVVAFKVETLMNGNVVQSVEQKVPVKDAKAAQAAAWQQSPDVKITDGKAMVKGKEVPAIIVEYTAGGQTAKIYMSDAVPVSGLVKMEVSGLPGPMMELADFGG